MAGVGKPSLSAQVRETAEMIKVSHSIFALPFAVAAASLGMAAAGGWSWRKLGWVVFCAVTARTAAMAQNRLVDARLDANNPRTAARALPAGRVTHRFVFGLVLATSALFVFGAGQLNRACLYLSPLALAVLLGYPYAKRFTSLCHVWLGVALGIAPVGAWVAVRGGLIDLTTPIVLATGVALWTAGFDLIYACQDARHDRSAGVFSLPGRWGVARSLRFARGMHALSVVALASLIALDPRLHWIYGVGLVVATAVLLYEHSIVSADDLSRVDLAFFTLNGIVALALGGAAAIDAWV